MHIRICFRYDPVMEVSKFRGDSKFSWLGPISSFEYGHYFVPQKKQNSKTVTMKDQHFFKDMRITIMRRKNK
jgi:hypothetical protein